MRDLEDRLERFLTSRLAADTVRIVTLSRSTEGFSQETFRFDAEVTTNGRRETRGWVVKREPIAGPLEPYGLKPEFRVLRDVAVLKPSLLAEIFQS